MRMTRRVGAVATIILVLAASLNAARKPKDKPKAEVEVSPLQLSGGRSLIYERSFSSEREVKLKRGFWTRVLDIVAGAPDYHFLVRPYSVVTDSQGRIIVTDPDAMGVHIFDFGKQKYKFLSREGGKDPLRSPQCVAVDAQDNIYVTDSETGKIFVYDANAKFRRVIGSLKGGEGYFKRPTGIAVDSAAQRIFVSDTLRHKVFVLDMQGNVVQAIGKRGMAPGEFNFPTELRLVSGELLVVDAMNFRVQALDTSGQVLYQIGRIGEINGTMFRPKGVGRDSEGNLYVVDGMFDTVQAFNRKGELLFYFGQSGDGPEEFQLPAGLTIDRSDRIYVADSYNHRVQIFRYSGTSKPAANGGGGQ
jgi:DNA-binding beta-propeller fold protein YncE